MAEEDVSDNFPVGLRVLIVDDDAKCLMILEKMLSKCLYHVTKCTKAEVALALLRDNINGYDLMISDVHMPDMDGFQLLEKVGLLMDIPVIMMSADDSKSVVMKGVIHGACDYLLKPVRMEALRNIWQHVVRKKKNDWKDNKDVDQAGIKGDKDEQHEKSEDIDYSSNKENRKSSKNKKDEEDGRKKLRTVWSKALHQRFVAAVNQLGIDAVPKKILELMNVPGLTRDNVASHLRTYKLYLRRVSGISHHQSGLKNSFMAPSDTAFGSEVLAANGQYTVLEQRNIFSYEASQNVGFDEGQQRMSSSSRQISLLHGIHTNMEPQQPANLHSAQPLGSVHIGTQITQNNSLFVNMDRPQGMGQLLSQTNGSHLPSVRYEPENNPFPQSSSLVNFAMNQSTDLPGNIFPLTGEMPTLASKGILQQAEDWGQNVRSTFDVSLRSTFELTMGGSHYGLAQHCPSPTLNRKQHPNLPFSRGVFSARESGRNNNSNTDQFNRYLTGNSPRYRFERLADSGCQNKLFSELYGQEGLMSAPVRQQHYGEGPVDNNFGYDNFPV